jgi:hypothetical protein
VDERVGDDGPVVERQGGARLTVDLGDQNRAGEGLGAVEGGEVAECPGVAVVRQPDRDGGCCGGGHAEMVRPHRHKCK